MAGDEGWGGMHRIVILDPRSVIVGERHRKDMGTPEQMADLAESIRTKGLEQNIGVTPDNKLIWGERRLRVVRDVLGWDAIAASVVDVDALGVDPVALEYDENELRKPFSVSEKVAIARTMKERIGNRRGLRTDLDSENTAENDGSELPDLNPEVESGAETRDVAARAAGLGSAFTLRQAEKVVDQGAPELVEAMDAGTISISAAAEVAALPAEKQAEVVEKVKKGKKPRAAIAEVKAEDAEEGGESEAEDDESSAGEADKLPTDEGGVALPEKVREAFAQVKEIRKFSKLIGEVIDEVNRLAKLPCGACMVAAGTVAHLENAKNNVWQNRPAHVCPACSAAAGKCSTCKGRGWVVKSTYQNAPKKES